MEEENLDDIEEEDIALKPRHNAIHLIRASGLEYTKSVDDISKIENLKNDAIVINEDVSHVNMEEIVLNIQKDAPWKNSVQVELNDSFGLFFAKIKTLSQTCYQMVKWMEHSYAWVEERYLRNYVKNTKKALAKRTKAHQK